MYRCLRSALRPLSAIYLAFALISTPSIANDKVPNDPQPQWWKGNIHTHSLWSDGNDFPEMIAEWYRTHDYNFLALSDHNILSEPIRWMKMDAIIKRGGEEVLPKYLDRFGANWVELRGEPGSPNHEVRLKPLHEFRSLVEERGTFIMIKGEEVSDSVDGKPVHMNATNLTELLQPLGGRTVQEAMRANLRSVQDQAERLGREIIMHLNHPNFGYGVTAEDLGMVVEESFFEVYNGHPGINHLGDATRPGDEMIWDIANAIRLGHLNAAPLMGVATDDGHSYHDGKGSTPGRGWIQVRARHLTPESLIRSMKAGDFYASSGVELEDVSFDPATKKLTVRIKPQDDVTFVTEFIGTKNSVTEIPAAVSANDLTEETETPNPIQLNLEQVGQVIGKAEGLVAEYTFGGDELYIRAVVTSSQPHPNASFKDQNEQAWTQPVGWVLKTK